MLTNEHNALELGEIKPMKMEQVCSGLYRLADYYYYYYYYYYTPERLVAIPHSSSETFFPKSTSAYVLKVLNLNSINPTFLEAEQACLVVTDSLSLYFLIMLGVRSVTTVLFQNTK